jgi:hypothetical protein
MSFPGLRKRHLLGNGNPWWEEEKQHPTTSRQYNAAFSKSGEKRDMVKCREKST